MTLAEPSTDRRLQALQSWLEQDLRLAPESIAPASADASFRRYFRVWHDGGTSIVMDAPPDKEDLGPFVAVAGQLAGTGVNVPRILAADPAQGFLLLTDLGSEQYLGALRQGANVDSLYGDAARALLAIQTRGRSAADSLPAYGVALLDRELQLFPDWFLGRHLGIDLESAERDWLERQFAQLCVVALEQPQVFVHRDYHSRNLMITSGNNPGILDFQDAVRGALTYDLVSLYKDCYIEWPRERVAHWVEQYRVSATAAGLLAGVGEREFLRWFDLMGLQRHLKVLGIFARLWYRDGKQGYLHDLPRVLAYVLEVARLYPELAAFDRWLQARVVPRFGAAQQRVLG